MSTSGAVPHFVTDRNFCGDEHPMKNVMFGTGKKREKIATTEITIRWSHRRAATSNIISKKEKKLIEYVNKRD